MLVQEIVSSVHRAVAEVVADGHWQNYDGPYTKSLESQLIGRVGQQYVQLTSSGTAALEILLRASRVGAGDEVLLSSYDYPGNFWAIERTGARPVLIDTSAESWRIDLESLERAFQPACKALIASHLHGELQKVDELKAWCDRRNILLIEDTCQSLGAQWREAPTGSYGHASIVSFGGGKVLSCGRGGAWATSDEMLAIKARVASGAGSGPYAMSELQAATVLAQMPYLDAINSRCRSFFKALDCELKASRCNWTFVSNSSLDSTAFYQCGWQLEQHTTEADRQSLLIALKNESPLNEKAPFELPFGIGFPGFHRRSTRRCRISHPIHNATIAANNTLVLHHRAALQELWTPAELASWITRRIAQL